MGTVCSTHGEQKNAYKVLVGKLEGKRPQGRRRCRRVDNIKMDLIYDGVVWTRLIWHRIGTSGGFL
jgi:transposase